MYKSNKHQKFASNVIYSSDESKNTFKTPNTGIRRFCKIAKYEEYISRNYIKTPFIKPGSGIVS